MEVITTVTHVKLCDFGLARKVPNVRYYLETGDVHKVPAQPVALGTPGYMAPEILSRRCFGVKADVWSVGIILFECLVGYKVPVVCCGGGGGASSSSSSSSSGLLLLCCRVVFYDHPF